jgi:hypothetical protein
LSERAIELRLRINFKVILFAMLLIHVFVLKTRILEQIASLAPSRIVQMGGAKNKAKTAATPFKLRDIRTIGSRESKRHDTIYAQKTPFKTNQISDKKFGSVPTPPTFMKPPMNPSPMTGKTSSPAPAKKNLSLKDLQDNKPVVAKQMVRPGTRPTIAKATEKMPKAKMLKGVSMKRDEIGTMARSESANALSGDPRAQSLSNSDVLVNLEVPEGVNPDELNEYELKFYGFQRRTAIGYVNTFYKHLDKFQRENPHKQFQLTDTKQVMTGRLTYDKEGNIMQIKMMRWSNVGELQNFFEDVFKDMDTLHNPPQALWEKNGEFSIYFSLVING